MLPRDPFARRFDDRGRPYQQTYGQVPPQAPPPIAPVAGMPAQQYQWQVPFRQQQPYQPMQQPYHQGYQAQAPLQSWPTNAMPGYTAAPTTPLQADGGHRSRWPLAIALLILLVIGAIVYGAYALNSANRKPTTKTPASTGQSTPNPNPAPTATTTPTAQPKDTSPEARARDAERLTDINALALQIEDYYSRAGTYPTLAQINDGGWLVQNMPQIPTEALKDPKGTDYTLADKPTANMYSYQPSTKDGQTCKAADVKCTKYTLTTLLEEGSTFAKKNSK
jgi:hypothetical protein